MTNTIWIFSYGSLMNDGWEQSHGCICRVLATLPGFSRAFDKLSIESRGTKEYPAPTLRIVPSDKMCLGVAFEFPNDKRTEILKELYDREGPAFPLKEQLITLNSGKQITALVPTYEGRNLIGGKTLPEIAKMAILAKGKRGSGVQYVEDILNHLTKNEINDPVVTDLWKEIQRQLGTR